MTFKRIMLLLMTVSLSGCASVGRARRAEDERDKLAAELANERAKASQLAMTRGKLEKEVQDLKQVSAVIQSEKGNVALQNAQIRAEIRTFIRRQSAALNALAASEHLTDRIGSEVIARKGQDNRVRLVVDFKNPLPSSATLSAIGIHAVRGTTVSLCILRPVGQKLVVLWQSKPVATGKSGTHRIRLPAPVRVEKGDFIGLLSPNGAQVVFDKGTGDGRTFDRNVSVGESIPKTSLGVSGNRAYSFCAYGLLD